MPYAMLASPFGCCIRHSVLHNIPPPMATLALVTTTQQVVTRHISRTNAPRQNGWRGACGRQVITTTCTNRLHLFILPGTRYSSSSILSLYLPICITAVCGSIFPFTCPSVGGFIERSSSRLVEVNKKSMSISRNRDHLVMITS